MKNVLIGLAAALLITGMAFAQQAQQPVQPPAGGQQMQQGMACPMMQQPGMMGSGMKQRMQQRGMMGNMAPQTSMVASDNGGVIILSGNRLLKFDKNLNLVKEVELFQKDGNRQEMPNMQAPAGKK